MKISDAKFRLYNTSPFFGSIIFNLPIVETDKIPTMAVDGEKLMYNPKFWDSFNGQNKVQLGLLCHEVGHLFLGHLWRRKHRDEMVIDPTSGQIFYLWNLAGDIVINNMILANPKLSLPKNLPQEKKYIGMSTEQVYEDLKKRLGGKGGRGKNGKAQAEMVEMGKNSICEKPNHKHGKKAGSKKARELEAKWKLIGKQALEHAKSKGDTPAGMERFFEELEPKEDWRQILLSYVQPFTNDYSFNPTDRRFLSEDFALPDIQSGEKIDWLAVAVDTSGSIGQPELNAFVSEIKAILGSFDKVKVRLTFCDAEASPFVELDEFDIKQIKPVGGGGTDFKPVFDLIKKEQNDPVALIYFTDLMGDFPDKAPDYETLWINTTLELRAPFGKSLPYNV